MPKGKLTTKYHLFCACVFKDDTVVCEREPVKAEVIGAGHEGVQLSHHLERQTN